jgi:hypothetical protein
MMTLAVYHDKLIWISRKGVISVPQMKPIDSGRAPCKKTSEGLGSEEEREDYLDYCAAAEAIDEALEEPGIKKTRDFA